MTIRDLKLAFIKTNTQRLTNAHWELVLTEVRRVLFTEYMVDRKLPITVCAPQRKTFGYLLMDSIKRQSCG